MKQHKNTLYYEKIFRLLLEGEVCSISKIGEQVGLSEKTVRLKIDQMNDFLKDNDMGRIEKRQGTGIWLEADPGQREALKRHMSKGGYMKPETDNQGRQMMGKLLKLKPGQTATLAAMADSLYLSPPTAGSILKEITPWFEERRIQVVSMRSKGFSLTGSEYSFRMAIKDYMLEMMPEVMEALLGTFAPGVDTDRVRRLVIEAENAWRIELADSSFKMVWIMACLSLGRRQYGGNEEFSAEEENIQHYNEYAFAESIYQRIGGIYQISIPDNDISLLAMLLLSAKRLRHFSGIPETDYAKQYDRDLGNFVNQVIDTIDAVLDIDLSQDRLLRESLILHLRSAIFRMKYSTAPGDNISRYVKNEYKQTFLAAWSTSNLFEEYYDVQVTEDELAGIALYIQAAIIRKNRDRRPLTALLVSRGGPAASQLNIEMLKYQIPEIRQIQTVSFHDFSPASGKEADVIINTTGSGISDHRAVDVGEQLSSQSIEAIRGKVNQIFSRRKNQGFCFSSLCHQLFEPDLILIKPKADNKDQLITMMVKKLEDKGDVTSDYLSSVFEREKATTTSIGRGIAIPHGNMREINEPRIVTAILDSPIRWHDDLVDVVFLLAVKMTSKFEIQRTKQFYREFLQLTDSDENLAAMKAMDSALEIYQYFIR